MSDLIIKRLGSRMNVSLGVSNWLLRLCLGVWSLWVVLHQTLSQVILHLNEVRWNEESKVGYLLIDIENDRNNVNVSGQRKLLMVSNKRGNDQLSVGYE